MSHLVMQGSYVNDLYDLSPHARRDYGFRSLHSANRPFRTSRAFLPKWLNFKSENGRRAPNKSTSQESTTETEQHSKIQEINESRNGKLSTRSSKTKRSSSTIKMREGLEEQQQKTNPKELKQEHDNIESRDRIMLVEEQKKRGLRIIRRFYLPSFFCIGLGTVFILGSSVHSIGAGTVFWDLHKAFRIIGAAVIVIGVIMLLATVGLANRRSERLKKRGIIIERNDLIHPDFLKGPDMKNQVSKQSLTKPIDAEAEPIQEYKEVSTGLYMEENISLLSANANCTMTDSSRRNGTEKPQIHRKKTNITEEDDKGFFFCNGQMKFRVRPTKSNGDDYCKVQRAMADTLFDDEVFLHSDMKSRQSSADVKEVSWHRSRPSESNYGANDDIFYEVSEMRQNGNGVGFIGKRSGFGTVTRKEITNIDTINGTCMDFIQDPRKEIKDVHSDITDNFIQKPQRKVDDVTMNITDISFRRTDDAYSDALMTSNIGFDPAFHSSRKNLKASSKRSFAFA